MTTLLLGILMGWLSVALIPVAVVGFLFGAILAVMKWDGTPT